MKYSVEQLNHLFKMKLKDFKKDDFMDDNYTNDYQDFKRNVNVFLKWIEEMEAANKIDELLSTMS